MLPGLTCHSRTNSSVGDAELSAKRSESAISRRISDTQNANGVRCELGRLNLLASGHQFRVSLRSIALAARHAVGVRLGVMLRPSLYPFRETAGPMRVASRGSTPRHPVGHVGMNVPRSDVSDACGPIAVVKRERGAWVLSGLQVEGDAMRTVALVIPMPHAVFPVIVAPIEAPGPRPALTIWAMSRRLVHAAPEILNLLCGQRWNWFNLVCGHLNSSQVLLVRGIAALKSLRCSTHYSTVHSRTNRSFVGAS